MNKGDDVARSSDPEASELDNLIHIQPGSTCAHLTLGFGFGFGFEFGFEFEFEFELELEFSVSV